jgi:ureidoglycolate dehydrogenase (NAD+)
MNEDAHAAPRQIAAEALVEWAAACLATVGMGRADADEVARSLVQTSLWGIDSHGLARLPHYLGRIAGGSIDPKPAMSVRRTGSCTAQLDGAHGLGILVCQRAMDEAIALARESGLGAVGVANSSHCGAVGLYGRQATRQGLVALALTHSDAFVAPHGGCAKFQGTNPICLAIPSDDPRRPICLDMATSAVPWNRVMNARRENRRLDPGWALDETGQPTTDPHAVACLLPLAGYKGYGLAFLIDLLCGPLNGMPFGPHIPPMYGEYKERRCLGSFMMAIDPHRFAGGSTLAETASRMACEARQQPRAAAAGEILVPGDPEYHCEQVRGRTGIPIDSGLWEEMGQWSAQLGVKLPGAKMGGNLTDKGRKTPAEAGAARPRPVTLTKKR